MLMQLLQLQMGQSVPYEWVCKNKRREEKYTRMLRKYKKFVLRPKVINIFEETQDSEGLLSYAAFTNHFLKSFFLPTI
jgi:hypothetical protein